MEHLPSYQDIKNAFPLSRNQSLFIEESRQKIRAILKGEDPRLLLIVGPCSIHDHLSAKEYAMRIGELASLVSPYFFLVMRAYCEKPRSLMGWKGFLYDPFLDGSHDIHRGIEWTRQLFLEFASLRIPVGTEFLDPLTTFYYDDLVTWGCIGARTSSSPIHRQFASGLNMPIGFKNGIAGNLSAAINGVLSASAAHIQVKLNEQGVLSTWRTSGNLDTHIILRGGESGPNYEANSVSEALYLLEHAKLPLRLLIDCSHHNSGKKYDYQPKVFQSVIQQIATGNRYIRGLMLESHLYAGNQLIPEDPSQLKYGISITDACLDWHTTADLIQQVVKDYHSC